MKPKPQLIAPTFSVEHVETSYYTPLDKLDCQATDEYHRIATLTAFTVKGYESFTRHNGSHCRFTFPDKSTLTIYHRTREAFVCTVDRDLGRFPLMINSRSKA